NREKAEALITLYGSNIDQIIEYIETNDSGLPDDLYAELMYAVHHEMALTPTDFFIRRTSKLLFEIENVKNQKEMVISFMAKQFDWTDDIKEKYTDELIHALKIAVEFDE